MLLLLGEDVDVVDGLIDGADVALVRVDNAVGLIASSVVLQTSLLTGSEGRRRRWQSLGKDYLLELVLSLHHHVFELLHLELKL